MKISKALIETKFSYLVELTGLNSSKDEYLAIDYNPTYGGYRLNLVKKENGTTFGCFGENGCEPRMKGYEFYTKLCALCEGIIYAKNNLIK